MFLRWDETAPRRRVRNCAAENEPGSKRYEKKIARNVPEMKGYEIRVTENETKLGLYKIINEMEIKRYKSFYGTIVKAMRDEIFVRAIARQNSFPPAVELYVECTLYRSTLCMDDVEILPLRM